MNLLNRIKARIKTILKSSHDTSIHWRVIGHKMTLYIIFAFPISSSLILWSAGLDKFLYVFGNFLLNFSSLLLLILVVRYFWSEMSRPFKKQLYRIGILGRLREIIEGFHFAPKFITGISGALILFFSNAIYFREVIDGDKYPPFYFMYLLGILSFLLGLTALIGCQDYIEGAKEPECWYIDMAYQEALNIIWPYTFIFMMLFFVTGFATWTFIQSTGIDHSVLTALIGDRETRAEFIINKSRLYAIVSLGAIGLITLIFLPRWYLSLMRAKRYYHKHGEMLEWLK